MVSPIYRREFLHSELFYYFSRDKTLGIIHQSANGD